MKIHDIGGHGGPRRPEGPGGSGSAEGASSKKPVERDRVELSEAARSRLALLKAAQELPDVRADRVDSLRRAIEAGAYSVDPRRLAQAILEFEDGLHD